jgi:phage baseplate assembly protein W
MPSVFSTEDGNLQNKPITISIDREYSDIDCTFARKTSGDVYKKTDAAAVRQSVKNLLLTRPGSVPFKPDFGGDLESLLFSLSTEVSEDEVEDIIKNCISQYEPRAKVRNVTATFNEDVYTLSVRLVFAVVNTPKVVTMNLTIARSR